MAGRRWPVWGKDRGSKHPGSRVGKCFPALPNVQRGRRNRKQRGKELPGLHSGGDGELGGSRVGARGGMHLGGSLGGRMDGGKGNTELDKLLSMF